ncbi:MAG: S8 family serine peptidase [Clostridia bacterium]|nr:S8 family serine peptidase [Clostridia bacterium]
MIETRKLKKILITFTCLVIGILLSIVSINYENKTAIAQETNQLLTEEYSENSIIVVLDENISEVNKTHSKEFFSGIDLESIVDLTWRENNQKSKNDNFRQILQLNLKNQTNNSLEQIISEVANIDGVKSVEANYQVDIEVAPNDSSFVDLWGLYGENGINAVSAWEITTGVQDITVGIIDTGIASHSDLNANLGDGYDFYNDNTITIDDTQSHGTHVAGTIGAVGNNYSGVVGINWNVTLIPLQASYESKNFYVSDLVEAIEWAEDQWGTNKQIDIINFSISGYGKSESILEAVRDYSGLFVWSAGNQNIDIDGIIEEDGHFDLSNLISVGAIKENGERPNENDWGYDSKGLPQGSNFSSNGENVNIYAPGDRIYSTVLNNSYANKSGTSMAAPHVTGVAALMLSVNPNLTAAELKSAILANSDTITISIPDGEGGTTTQTVKKLNAFKAVSSVAFETNEAGNCITGLNFEPSEELTIPSVINGVTINSIGANVFSGCTSLTQIALPSTLTSIGANAFAGCTGLTSITIPASVTSIGNGAFDGCANLETVKFYGSPSIGDYAFRNCGDLSSVYFYTNTVPTLGTGAFSDTDFVLYVPYNAISAFSVFSEYASLITSEQRTISFVCDGVNISPMTVYYGATITDLPTPAVTGYTLEGWYDNVAYEGTLYENGGIWESEEDITLYAKWTANTYYVKYDANGGWGTMIRTLFHYDEPKALRRSTFNKTGHNFVGWATTINGEVVYEDREVVENLTAVDNKMITLYAVWERKTYAINYMNLTFQGETADLLLNNDSGAEIPTEREYGTGLSLSNITAVWQNNGPYQPHLVFIGWCTDSALTTLVSDISAGHIGDVTLYAKWRYDFNQYSRSGEYLITDVDPYTESYYDSIYLGLKSNGLYEDLEAIGINYLTIEFKVSIKEVDDGYQEILIYNGATSSYDVIWSVTDIDHDPSGTNTTAVYYIYTVNIELSELSEVDRIYFRYGANGNGDDDWITEEAYFDVMFTVAQGDDLVKEFTWAYADEVADEDCVRLETVSEDLGE